MFKDKEIVIISVFKKEENGIDSERLKGKYKINKDLKIGEKMFLSNVEEETFLLSSTILSIKNDDEFTQVETLNSFYILKDISDKNICL